MIATPTTAAWEMRLRGFNASLDVRGVALKVGDKEFTGLVSYHPGQFDQFELGPAQRIDGQIHVLRETYSPLGIAEHTLITEIRTGRVWRVTHADDNPVNVAVVLDCNLES